MMPVDYGSGFQIGGGDGVCGYPRINAKYHGEVGFWDRGYTFPGQVQYF